MTEAPKNKDSGSLRDHSLFYAASLLMFGIFLVLVFILVWGRLTLVHDISPTVDFLDQIHRNENQIFTVFAICMFFYLVFLLVLRLMRGYNYPQESNAKYGPEHNGWFVFGTLLSGMAVVGALIALAGGRLGLSNAPEIQTGVIIVLAVSVLTLLLFVLTLGFRSLGLSNVDQPLALPSGSVRAFIALMLIMIFVILSVYAVRSVGEGVYAYLGIRNLAETDEIAHRADADGTSIVSQQVACPKRLKVNEDTLCYQVWRRRPLSDDGISLAQQLTTTVATLVVAVSGFYFGSQAVEQATKAVSASAAGDASAKPLIGSIDPTSGESSAIVSVQVKGRNLFATRSVKLVNDQETIEADNILSGDNTIECSFTLDKPAGTTWSVIVENARGNKDTLEDAFKITEKPVSSSTGPATTSDVPPPEQTPPASAAESDSNQSGLSPGV